MKRHLGAALIAILFLSSTGSAAPAFYCKFRHWVVDVDNVLDQALGVQARTCSFTLGDKTWYDNGVGACLFRQWWSAFFKNEVGIVKVQVENLVDRSIPVTFTILSRPVSMWEPQSGTFKPWRALSHYRDFYFLLHLDDPKPASQWLTQPELVRALTGQKDPSLSDIALVVDSTKQEVNGMKMRAAGRLSFYVADQEDAVYNVRFTTNWGITSGVPPQPEALRAAPHTCTEPLFQLFGFSHKAFDLQLEAK